MTNELLLKRKLEEILIFENDLLSEHIEIHNKVFNPPLRAKIPIPFIFKKINFDELHIMTNDIQRRLIDCINEINRLSNIHCGNKNLDGIKKYSICFLASISKLNEITYELQLKAKRESKLSFKEYTLLIEEYQENEQQRLNYANLMNEIVKEVIN